MAAVDSTAAPPASSAIRLVLCDEACGGQRMKTVRAGADGGSGQLNSLTQVLALLSEHLGFAGLCEARGLEPKALLQPASGGGGKAKKGGEDMVSGPLLHIVGVLDGAKHVPILKDETLRSFLAAAGRLRTLEVRLDSSAGKAAPGSDAAASDAEAAGQGASGGGRGGSSAGGRGGGSRGKARDKVELLEDENAKLLQGSEKLTRRVEELERLTTGQREEARQLVETVKRQFLESQAEFARDLRGQLEELKAEVQQGLRQDLQLLKAQAEEEQRLQKQQHRQLEEQLKEHQDNTAGNFSKTTEELTALKATDEALRAEAQQQQADLQKQQEELILKSDRAEAEKAKEEQIAALAELSSQIQAQEKLVEARLEQNKVEVGEQLRVSEEEVRKMCTEQHECLQGFEAQLAEAQQTRQEVQELKAAMASMEERLLAAVDGELKVGLEELKKNLEEERKTGGRRVDELAKKTEATFRGLHERMEEMGRVERARLGSIERGFEELAMKIQADCRAELERLRADYERDASRLDEDLADLHMKQDVAKQELNFCTSRLQEQRSWVLTRLQELATAARATGHDLEEGLAASTTMLHALKDDAVGFREKMAKYVAALQQSADSQADALGTLEAQRSRMRLELDALTSEHEAYTSDMDSWADDVRLKVERLFRALEPTRAEWCISRAAQRAKELRRPLAVKSQTFSLKGLREVQMEFYPEGHNTSPEGRAVVRLFLPPSAHVRYQCWVGKTSEGVREHRPGGSFSVDLLIDTWKNQIHPDGSVRIVLEVLRDLKDEDESLAREVHIETP